MLPLPTIPQEYTKWKAYNKLTSSDSYTLLSPTNTVSNEAYNTTQHPLHYQLIMSYTTFRHSHIPLYLHLHRIYHPLSRRLPHDPAPLAFIGTKSTTHDDEDTQLDEDCTHHTCSQVQRNPFVRSCVDFFCSKLLTIKGFANLTDRFLSLWVDMFVFVFGQKMIY